jgi:transketolase
MQIRPDEPDWPDRDRFVLSKGHANAALGAVLAQAGFIDDALLDRFYHFESPFGMHPDIKVPGVEMCTGALGHGLAIATGMAMGARIQKKTFHTFVMLGDAELHEGSNWEAALAAAHYKLDGLTAIVDYNKIGQSGPISELIDLDPLGDKWRAFGWQVREFDGHDMGAIVDALDALPLATGRPSALIAHTVKGKGVSFAENTYLWHSNSVDDEIHARALGELEDK